MSWEVLEDLRRTREARVVEIISDELLEPVVKPEMRLREDLGADSLDMVILIMALKDGFGLDTYTISDDEFYKCVTVQDVIELVHRRVDAETEGRG